MKCDEAVDHFLAALKLVPDWFFASKMIINFLLLCSQIKKYSILMKILTFSCNEMGILDIDLNDNSFDEDDPDTIILINLLA